MKLYRTKSGVLVFTDEATLHNYDEHDEAVYTFEINYETEYSHEVNAQSQHIYKEYCTQEKLIANKAETLKDYMEKVNE